MIGARDPGDVVNQGGQDDVHSGGCGDWRMERAWSPNPGLHTLERTDDVGQDAGSGRYRLRPGRARRLWLDGRW